MVKPTIEEALRIKESGLAKAVDFPPTLVALELVIACGECYHSQNRRIVTKDGRVLVNLSTQSIGRTFGILTFDEVEEAKKEFTLTICEQDPLWCKRTINQARLKDKRRSANKVS